MSQELLNKIAACDPDNVITTRQPKTNTTVTLADGQTAPILEVARIQFKIFDEELDELFYILKDTHSTILGWPFFANNDLTIDCKRRLLIRENCTFQINTISTKAKSQTHKNNTRSMPHKRHYHTARKTRISILPN